MNLRLVSRLLGRFVMFFALAGLPAFAMAVFEAPGGAIDGRAGLLAMAVAGLVVGGALSLLGRGTETEMFRRESLLVVGLAWLFAGCLGGVPFWFSGALPNPIDAVFECVSGLTTCGATVLGSPDHAAIHELPQSLLMWRSFIQWIGGLGIILMFVVLLPALGISPWSLAESESVGASDPRVRPRMVQRGRVLLRTYLLLTTAEFLLLWLAGGMSVFRAACHAMTTMSTGGFSTEDASIAAFGSVTVELIVFVFMVFAASNFILLRDAMFGGMHGLRGLWRDPEFRTYASVLGVSILVAAIGLRVWGGSIPDPVTGGIRDYAGIGTCLRDSAFNVTSLMTSTGYGTANFQFWPSPLLLWFLALMFVGASTGSTAGGIKMFRGLILARMCVHKLRSFVRPRSVEHVKFHGAVLDPREVGSVFSIALIFAIAIVAGALVLSLDPRLDLLSAFSASLSATCCVGPGLTAVIQQGGEFTLANASGIDVGPFGSYGSLWGISKLVMALLMIFGRLEFLALLCLFTPGFWRRR